MEDNEDVADRNEDGLTGWIKTQGNWIVETGGQMPRIEVAGDICFTRPRPTQGCRADDDDDDDDETPNASRTFIDAVCIIPAGLRII